VIKKNKDRRTGTGRGKEQGREENEDEKIINLFFIVSTNVHFFLITCWKGLTAEKRRIFSLRW
jgi:hypothetical protein